MGINSYLEVYPYFINTYNIQSKWTIQLPDTENDCVWEKKSVKIEIKKNIYGINK